MHRFRDFVTITIIYASLHSDNHLSTIKRLRKSGRRITFDSAKSQYRFEDILGEPMVAHLALKTIENAVNFRANGGLVQRNKDIRRTEITIIFWNLIFKN